jgi:hypothetical protein
MFGPKFALAVALLALAPAAALAQLETAPAAPKTADQAANDKANEMICRRQQETGSLVKVKKTCHTRAQWDYIQQENRRMGQEFVQNNTNRPGGN